MDTKKMHRHTYVSSANIKLNHLLTDVLKGHVIVAASNPAFFESKTRLDMNLLTVSIKLTPQSLGFAFFQKQLAQAVAFWDSAYAGRLKEPPKTELPEHGSALESFWAHPPGKRILLVFNGIEHVQSGPVYDFLYGLVNHPLENMAIILLTPSDMSGGVKMDPEEARDLSKAADWIAQEEFGELEAFFVQRGIRYTSPALTKEYLQLFRRIPEKVFEFSPVLQIMQAGMFSITGQVEKAHYVLRRAGAALEAGKPSAEQRWALGEIYLLHAFLSMSLGIYNFLTLLQKADRLLPGGSNLLTCDTGMCLGNNRALIYPGFEKQDIYQILDTMNEANPYLLRLTKGFGYGRHYLAATEVYYYTDQFHKTKISAQRAISRAGEYGQWDLQCYAHCLLMQVAIAQGDYRQVMKHLHKMKECRLRYGEKEQHILFLPDLAEAEFYLKIGEGQRVAPWLLEEPRSENAEPIVFTGIIPILRAACLMESGKLLDALDAAEKALQQFTKYKNYILVLQTYILKAVLYSQFGELELAIVYLRLAYEMEDSNDLIMMFAEYGRHMAAFMEQVRDTEGHGIPEEWIDRLQHRSETYSRHLGHLRSIYLSVETGDSLLGHLTKRERESMELLSEGLSNQQIADRMGIRLTSLKTNLQRIYGKIGAENRADAVRLWLTAKK